jgi:hypothetical protein
LTDQGPISGATPFISIAKQPALDEGLASSTIMEAITQESVIESTVRACITSIENALIKFEQSDTTSHDDSLIAVHNEMKKANSQPSEGSQELPVPWKVIPIARKAEMASPQTVAEPVEGKPSADSVPGDS